MKISGSLNNKINGTIQSRFSMNNIFPKPKNEQIKPQLERSNSMVTPNNKILNKQNTIISKNNKAIEQITKGSSILDKKGILKNDGYQPTKDNELGQLANTFTYHNKNSQYTEEEIQAYNATIPIRGSYRESYYPAVAIPQKQLAPLRDGQKKQSKKVSINVEDTTASQFKEGVQQVQNQNMNEKIQLANKRNNEDLDGALSNIIKETTTEKQSRIDGQIKRYMQKVGLQKKDKFPVFYTLDENGKEVKTSLSNPQTYAKVTKQQQPYFMQQQQQQQNFNNTQKNNYMTDTKSKKNLNRASISEDTLPAQNDNLADIMKICSEFQKTIQNFDKKNYKSAKKNGNDFRKLNNQLKQIDIQNLIIQESDDPALQPYYQHLKEQGRINEPKIKKLLNS